MIYKKCHFCGNIITQKEPFFTLRMIGTKKNWKDDFFMNDSSTDWEIDICKKCYKKKITISTLKN